MPRTGLDHKRFSLVSLALIAGFSFAAVVVSGWLVMIITFSNDVDITNAVDPEPPVAVATSAGGAADVTALAAISASRAEGALPGNAPPSAGMPPPPVDGATAATYAGPTAVGAPSAALGGPAGEMTYSGPGDLLNFQSEDENPAPGAVPLPPPRPRRTAAVPMPRPRPSIDGEQATPAPPRSLFDIFVGR